MAEIIETLNDQVAKEKIHYFGCSNWTVERIQQAQEYASKHCLKSFVANQMMWSLAVPNPGAFADKDMFIMNREGVSFHTKTGLTAIPYSSQANGFLSK